MKIFEDRSSAGTELANFLKTYKSLDGMVLALPRGGVPVGLEVAKHLGLPLDVFVARKIGAPFNPEFGIGAIAEGNVIVWDEGSVRAVGVTKKDLANIVAKETKELERRIATYRGGRTLPEVKDKIVILVDDGLATGITATAAIRSLRQQKPKSIVLAVPVCASDSMQKLKHEADQVICVQAPINFMAVGQWYRNFEQLSDDDVIKLLGFER